MSITLDEIVAVLQARGGLAAWQAVESRSRSTQRYTVFTRDEALRQVDTRRFHVMVHVRHSHDGKPTLGESSFVVGPEVDRTEVERQVDGALARAKLVHNEPYELPTQESSPEVRNTDERVVENPAGVADEITGSIRSAVAAHAGVELSSSEVFADYSWSHIRNSRGLDVTRQETELLVEYVLLARDPAGEEHEIWQSPKSRLLDGMKLGEHIDRYVQYTQDGLRAELPQSGTFDVVFGEEALDTLFSFFVSQANAGARYEGWSRMKLDAPVIDEIRGEKLTLISDPTLPGGLHSQAYDGQGQACRRTTIIDDNVFKAFIATKKFAELTGVPATGPMGNTVVRAGTNAYDALLQGDRPVYELLRFSTLTPNAISGAFSGEIRTGYVHQGGKRVPIKGGSVSGTMLQAFRDAHFSRETVRREAYDGPRGVRLGAVTVTGRG